TVINDSTVVAGNMTCDVIQVGPLLDKAGQVDDLATWFKVALPGPAKDCASTGCGIAINGELEFASARFPYQNNTVHNVKISTSDFTFENITIDVTGLESRAEKGDVEAQYTLGTLYFMDDNVAVGRDYARGISWLRKAAAQNDARA